VTDVDRRDPEAKAVTLMTLHNAKGLEYPSVFIAGLEEGLFPMARALDEPDGIEEERRIFYVGITRARRKLYLLHARTRRRAGETLPCMPSSFLASVPPALLDQVRTPALGTARNQGSIGWGGRRESFGGFGAGARMAGAGGAGSRSRADAPAADGFVVDYDHAQDAPRFVKGERVRHPQFGRGTIRELSGFGLDLKAVIDFDGLGRKKVVLRYANLQKEL
jgi:DNA helicase II / ATP-dependent DNA helicase PcrA